MKIQKRFFRFEYLCEFLELSVPLVVVKDQAQSHTEWEIQLHRYSNLDTGTLRDEYECYYTIIYFTDIIVFPFL